MKGSGRLGSLARVPFPLRCSSSWVSLLISLNLFCLVRCTVRNWLSAESVLCMQCYPKGPLIVLLGVSDWDLKPVFAVRENQWSVVLHESQFLSHSLSERRSVFCAK